MDLLEHHRRQFDYDNWANREVLAGLPSLPAANIRMRQLLAHILSAQQLWLERIRKEPQTFPVWPDFSVEQCERQISEMASLWQDYLRHISSATLSDTISYTNSKGETWTSTVNDILAHVLLHSSYHRGQIASLMRAAGAQPPYTDFIYAAREGLIE